MKRSERRVEKEILRRSVMKTLAPLAMLSAALQLQAQAVPKSYPQMASIDEYMINDRAAEITMARSAAPQAISDDATVLVLGKSGYETATKGKGGFTCLVERSWMSPLDSPEFWNPKIRGPICYNPAAARTILPYTINRTKLALTGLSIAQMRDSISAAVARQKLPTAEAGAMSYMLSKEGDLGNAVGHWCPHLMFHVSNTESTSWGANVEGSPVVYNSQYRDMPEQETIFMIPVSHWSDGTAAPHDATD